MNDPSRWRFSSEEFYVKSAEEMAVVFAEKAAEANARNDRFLTRMHLFTAFGMGFLVASLLFHPRFTHECSCLW